MGEADKIHADQEAERRRTAKLPLGPFVHGYFARSTGLAACADVQTAQLFRACEAQSRLPRVAVFAAQVGLLDRDESPPMDVRDTEFVLLLLRTVAEQQQEQLHLQQLHDAKAAASKVRLPTVHCPLLSWASSASSPSHCPPSISGRARGWRRRCCCPRRPRARWAAWAWGPR